MTRLVEDILSQEDYAAIEAVLDSVELRFDKLAKIAGLDPTKDFRYSDLRGLNFCGADLRGFDFSGSDLRDIAIDGNTIIDDTTILAHSRVRWVEIGDAPIVELMFSVQRANGRDARQDALAKLEERFGKSAHVRQFIMNAAFDAPDLEAFIDYLDFIPDDLSKPQLQELANKGEKLLRKRYARARSRTRRQSTSIFATSKIIEQLSTSRGSVAERWYGIIAKSADEQSNAQVLQGVFVEPDPDFLISSLKRLAE